MPGLQVIAASEASAAGDRLQVRPVGERIDLVDECEAECESCAEVKFLFVRRCAEIWGDKRGR